ncbi:beta-glucosidase [Exophiala aquamarina CBS 119918]|uniref:beta-glucosidase n=1 Tax=Exophiala aquamarina CBS 119918 TaxID=1182545 RepID=A0A072NVY2_9EURO|nr:beta-glucosidase [Exophiala aquamarina CBS 119918]KEF51562.1 beta-glucosidase [Exophiala aquamarina CBS 119918]
MGSIAPDFTTYDDFHVDQVLAKLTPDEKISLISGSDPWHTAPIPRFHVPKIRLTDGPNGVRGTKFFNGVPAACLPCGTALASTWDIELVRQGGALQGREAIAKGASVILGPTTNMQRSPLGGRGFESFSEDPVLAGHISAATVCGIQSTGVAATIKHFVCNDQEHERQSVDCVVSERALREIYLMPFQIAERLARPKCYMTAYNKVNGLHASSSKELIQNVLREEWGFDGLVMSDWFGVYSVVDSIKAGLDLEMPGPTYMRGQLVKHALGSGRLLAREVDARAKEVLKLVRSLLPLGIPEDCPEEAVDTPETAALLRKIASNSLVLLKNVGKILPFSDSKTIGVIGPNAAFAAYCGGGSAALAPYYAVTPLDGVRARYKEDKVKYELGAPGWKKLPLLSQIARRSDFQPGFDAKVFLEAPSSNVQRKPVDSFTVTTSDIFLADYKNDHIEGNLFYMEFDASFTPDETAEYEFSLSVSGTAKLYVAGQCVVDNATNQTAGDSFFGSGTVEETGTIALQKGEKYPIHISFGTLPTRTYTVEGANPFGAGGLRAGGFRKIEIETELERAATLAKSVDQVLLCVGLNGDWESEGYDRSTMDLPAGSDDLIRAVLQANSNTAVVVQSGTPVTLLPWAKDAPAIIQAWYGGNETGNAIADVVFGVTNPSGKLPLSFPVRNEDNPAFLNYRSERGRTVYGEGVYIGYRFYERTKREVAFPFGHGLSYTSFELSSLQLQIHESAEKARNDLDAVISVSVDVANTGLLPGAQVVQVYAAAQAASVGRPVKELKGFTKVFLQSSERRRVSIEMSLKYVTSFWDEQAHAWVQEQGRYTLHVGDSSAHTPLTVDFEVAETVWWNGL